MSDFRIQRPTGGFSSFGASADSIDVALLEPVDLARAFVVVHGVVGGSAGPEATTTAARSDRDLLALAELVDSNTLRLSRLSTGEDADYRVYWEVWEYTGPTGGEHEWAVRGEGAAVLNTGVLSASSAPLAGVVDVGRCVVFPAGAGTNSAGQDWAAGLLTYRVEADGSITAERLSAAARALSRYTVVEFVGSAWSVANNLEHVWTAAGVDQELAHGLGFGSWDEAFLVGSHRATGSGLANLGYTLRPGAMPATARARLHADASGSPGNHAAVVAVVHNVAMRVQHLDSITGGGAVLASGDLEVDRAVDELGELEQVAVLAHADCAGTGTAYPRAHWGYALASSTSLRLRRARSGQGGDWSAMVVQLPRVLRPEPALAEAVVEPAQVELALGASLPSAGGEVPDASVAVAVSAEVATAAAGGGAAVLELELAPEQAVAHAQVPAASVSYGLEQGTAVAYAEALAPAIGLELAASIVTAHAVAPEPDLDVGGFVIGAHPAIAKAGAVGPGNVGFPGACVVASNSSVAERVLAGMTSRGALTSAMTTAEVHSSVLVGAHDVQRRLHLRERVVARLRVC